MTSTLVPTRADRFTTFAGPLDFGLGGQRRTQGRLWFHWLASETEEPGRDSAQGVGDGVDEASGDSGCAGVNVVGRVELGDVDHG